MNTQESLFVPGSGGREVSLQERLLARRTDPQTSKDAACTVATHLTKSQADALYMVRQFGPGTCAEIAARAAVVGGGDATVLYHQLARRLPELQPEQVDVEQVDGRDVTRNGARVWRLS